MSHSAINLSNNLINTQLRHSNKNVWFPHIYTCSLAVLSSLTNYNMNFGSYHYLARLSASVYWQTFPTLSASVATEDGNRDVTQTRRK